ncbi:hypothetical protein KTR10_01735 [Candidatus Kaiserbacteria bacterium]|nr:hypothetical protein [Candidatus Kaiserbacteria bacterium]
MKHLKPFTVEILLIVVLAILSLGILGVFWMPMGMHVAALALLVVFFGAYAIYGLRERGGDEREVSLLHKSDRVAFFAGATVLLIAIIYESITNYMSDPWIVVALFAMVVAKAGAYIYHNR